MKRTREILKGSLGDQLDISAAVISHMHTDHIGYYPLRVLENLGVQVRVHENCLLQLREKHFNGRGLTSLRLKSFCDSGFSVGDLGFEPFEVPHNPWYPTYGLVIKYRRSKIVIATDFCDWQGLLDHFVDSDFVFVECNHDLDLLERHFNPNSQFHMPNPQTGDLLCVARECSRRPPQAVMLGHLSEIRNRPDIALREVESCFESNGAKLDFPLLVAPKSKCSEAVTVNQLSRGSVVMPESGHAVVR